MRSPTTTTTDTSEYIDKLYSRAALVDDIFDDLDDAPAVERNMVERERDMADPGPIPSPGQIGLRDHILIHKVRNDNDEEVEECESVYTDASEPPPPPPPLPPSFYSFREKAKNLFQLRNTKAGHSVDTDDTTSNKSQGSPRAWIVEQGTDIESIDVTARSGAWKGQGKWGGMMMIKASPLRRRIFYSVLALFFLCLILGLSIGLSNNNNDNNGSTTSSNYQAEAPSTPSPVASPTTTTTSQTSYPTVAKVPLTLSPTIMDNSTVAPTMAPTMSCIESLLLDKTCYKAGDLKKQPLEITFSLCAPHPENWIGIYESDQVWDNLDTPKAWSFTCDSKKIKDCGDEGPGQGVLYFDDRLPDGMYQAYMIERDGLTPYTTHLASAVFEVGKNCPEE